MIHHDIKSLNIAIGSANFYNQYGINNKKKLDFIEILKILKFADIKNFRFIDTAFSYNNYEILYKYFSENHQSNLKIINKINSYDLNYYDQISDEIIKRTEFVLIHNANDLKDKTFLKYIKKYSEKYNFKIGVSIYSDFNLESLVRYNFNIIQLPLNLFDKNNLKIIKNQNKFKNTIFQIRSIFLQGLYEKKFFHLKHLLNIDKQSAIILENMIENKKLSLGHLSLIWVKHVLPNSILTFGIDSYDQIRKNYSLLQKKILNYNDIIFLNKLKSKNIKMLDPRIW